MSATYSVNTTQESECFAMSPRSATRPLYVWYFDSNFVFFSGDVRCPSEQQSGPPSSFPSLSLPLPLSPPPPFSPLPLPSSLLPPLFFFSRQVDKFVVLTFSEVKKENNTKIVSCLYFLRGVFFQARWAHPCGVHLLKSQEENASSKESLSIRRSEKKKHASRDVLFNHFVWFVFCVRSLLLQARGDKFVWC